MSSTAGTWWGEGGSSKGEAPSSAGAHRPFSSRLLHLFDPFPICHPHPAVPSPFFPMGGLLKEECGCGFTPSPASHHTGPSISEVQSTAWCPQYHEWQPQTGTARLGPGARLQPRVPDLPSDGFGTCAGTGCSGTGSSLGSAGASVGGVFFIDLDRTRA